MSIGLTSFQHILCSHSPYFPKKEFRLARRNSNIQIRKHQKHQPLEKKNCDTGGEQANDAAQKKQKELSSNNDAVVVLLANIVCGVVTGLCWRNDEDTRTNNDGRINYD
jgi:hypothetical protein